MTFNDHPGVYPTHYKGSLTDGRFFDFVYRGGQAVISVRVDSDDHDHNAVVMDVATTNPDMFDSDEQRDAVFAELLQRRLRGNEVTR